MNRFSIGLGYKEYSIDVENYKFIIGNNINVKYSFYSVIKSAFSKINNSDYAIECNNKHQLKFNEKVVDPRKWKYFEVTPFFDFETDLKMGTKSLFSKYYESFADNLEQNEIYNTISILVNSLNDDFFDKETKLSFGEKTIGLRLGEISRGTFSKEVIPSLTSNDLECNFSDLSYEDIIILQLNIIERIMSKGVEENVLVYCYIPQLTRRIESAIYGMTYENGFIFIDTSSIPNVRPQDIYIAGKHCIDPANDEDLIDKIMDFPFHIEKDNLILKLKNTLKSQKIDFSDSLMIELFS